MIYVRCIRRIIHSPVKSDDDIAAESISDTENWPNCDGGWDNPNDSKDNCAADHESDIECNNGIDHPEYRGRQDVSTTPNVLCLVLPTKKQIRQAEKVLGTVNTVETKRNQGVKKK
jgi:hypothetical protein